MSDVTDAPKAGLSGLKKALEKVPKWAWVAGGGGFIGFLYYDRKKKAAAAAAAAAATTNNTNPNNATPTADQGLTDQGIDPATGVSYASELAAAYANQSDAASYGSGSSGGGGGYSDGSVSSGSPDTTGTQELSDFGTLLSTLSSAGLTGPASSQNALSTSGAGTTPAAPVPTAAPGVVVGNQSATPGGGTTNVTAPAPKTVTGCPAAFPHSSSRGCYATAYVIQNGKAYNKHTYQNGQVEYVLAPTQPK
jgi:hypothetical protein